MQLEGRTFLVTGGGSGLGAATVRLLAARGARVMVADVACEAGQALAEELGDGALFRATDVTRADSTQAAVDAAVRAFGALHGAVNCAGVVHGARVLDRDGQPHDLDAFRRVIEVNLVGTFNLVRLAAQAMTGNEPGPDGERGVIVNTASVAAFDGQIGQAAYAASKAGVAGLTLPLARDLASRGVRVMTVAPGIFETPMMESLPDEIRESLGKQTPFPARLGRPEEFAALVACILENRMLNGEVIRLDGAIRMAPK